MSSRFLRSCHSNGSLSFIFMPISQNNRNILHSNAATFTMTSRPPKANTARVALMGNVTVIYPEHDRQMDEEEIANVERCFLKRHPDAKWWIPGRRPAHTVCGEYLPPPPFFSLLFSLPQGVLGAIRSSCELVQVQLRSSANKYFRPDHLLRRWIWEVRGISHAYSRSSG